jgi:hypothetical protein
LPPEGRLTIEKRLALEAEEGAEEFRRLFEKRCGRPLPVSMDSVRELDHLVYREAMRGVLTGEGKRLIAVFFGEVLRRGFGGRYERDARRGTVALRIGSMRAYPALRVERAIENMRESGVGADAFTPGKIGPLEGYMFNLGRRLSEGKGG